MSKPNNKQPQAAIESGPKVLKGKKARPREETGQHPVFEPNAAGIDIGAREIVASLQQRWRARECTGFRCTTCWNNTASGRAW